MPAQPLHQWTLGLDAALEDASDALTLWGRTRRLPEVPAFSGGLLDSWPAWAADALGIVRQEEERVSSFLQAEATYG